MQLSADDLVNLSQMLEQPADASREEKDGNGASLCWGTLLLPNKTCTAGFEPSRGHFKNKFCKLCREHGIVMPAACVRSMRPDAPLANNMSHGFWNHAFDIGRYRVINQTADCTGPPLVVLEKPPHDALVLGRVGPVPPAVVSARTDFVHLVVSKGKTLKETD